MLDRLKALVYFVTTTLVCALALHAQVITATLFGTVTDKTGAVIPGAVVTATNVGTGLVKTTRTGDAGGYRLEFLPVGTYKLQFSAPGFGGSTQTGLALSVNQELKLDASLSPGATVEQVEVTGAAPVMNTSNGEVGTTVENVQVTELPIVNRNVYTLLNVVPGVQQNSNQVGLGLPEQHTSINGGVEAGYSGSVNYFLDGGENVSSLRNAGGILPNPDAIEEFRVQANNYSAEYGRFPNGVINVITKSGSNTFHGSAFEFWRNDALNAASRSFTSATSLKPPQHRHQFGATLGGPIFKDRTFFFGSYAGLRENLATFVTGSVLPSPAERNSGNAGYYDFRTPTAGSIPKNPYTGTAFSCNGIANTICANDARIDPVAVKLLNAWVPSGFLGSNGKYTYTGSILTPNFTDDFLLKLDHRLGNIHQLSGAYFSTAGTTTINAGGSLIPYARLQYIYRQQNFNVSDTMTLSPRTVNQVWVTYLRAFGRRYSNPGLSLADYGSSFLVQGAPSLPNISVTGYFTLGDQISGLRAGNNFYSIRDLASHTLSKQNIRFGGEVSLNKDQQYTNLGNYGNFAFNSGITGNGFADFLLGIPSAVGQDQPSFGITNSFVYSMFVQDDWRFTQRLTLNFGLRYDYQTAPTDPQNKIATFIAGRKSTVYAFMPTGLQYYGDPGVARGIANSGPFHISPRFGFALDVFGNGKTAIHGGIGQFFGGVSGNGWNQPQGNLPFIVSIGTFANGNNINGATLSNPYRNYPGGSPFPYTGGYYVNGALIKTIASNYVWPYTYQMNLSVQQQLPGGVVFTAGYVGSLARRLPFLVDVNYPVYYAPGTGPNVTTGAACSGSTTLCGSSAVTANVNARRPLPQAGAIQQLYSNQSSNYHSLQLVGEKRLHNGISFTTSYVYSKTMVSAGIQNTTNSAQDYNNVRAEYGLADTDARQVFTMGAVWQIDYFHTGNRFVRSAANGWQLSPILRAATGNPLNITNGLDANLDGNGTDRPTLVGDWHPAVRSAASWFNPAAFHKNSVSTTAANPLVDGNTPRNFISAPGFVLLDLGVARTFSFFERAKLEVRAEATNSLNHVNLGAPGTNVNGSNFGVVTSAGAMRQVQLGGRITF